MPQNLKFKNNKRSVIKTRKELTSRWISLSEFLENPMVLEYAYCEPGL
jgi:hypothetical protein